MVPWLAAFNHFHQDEWMYFQKNHSLWRQFKSRSANFVILDYLLAYNFDSFVSDLFYWIHKIVIIVKCLYITHVSLLLLRYVDMCIVLT